MTTSVYLPNDSLALTLNSATHWPTAKELRKLGQARASAAPSKIRRILDRIADAIREATAEVDLYTRTHAQFAELVKRMLQEWRGG